MLCKILKKYIKLYINLVGAIMSCHHGIAFVQSYAILDYLSAKNNGRDLPSTICP